MGTRADFYIGRGANAEWLGSIAFDGYPDGIAAALLRVSTAGEFKNELNKFFSDRSDVSLPRHGWPWPWPDSRTTDYAYAFDDGRVWACPFGQYWFPATAEDPDLPFDKSGTREEIDARKVVFPDMTQIQNVTLGKRSGLLIIGPCGPMEMP